MNKNKLKTFAKNARTKLITQVKGKLEYMLNLDSSEIKNKENQISQLREEIGRGLINQTQQQAQEEVIEKVAYTWFNRFIALRYMDANNYHTLNMKILSSTEGHSLPEILQEAKRGNIDDRLKVDRDKINDLIDGKISSKDAQSEIYQMLIVGVCNYYHKLMPFMFERIEDYTELLLPDNLLTDDSIIKDILDNIAEEDCQDVEIIGWLYQFYISEKKDQVFEGLKKNVKITAQNIPAATQLFTPHWIVRYMVENSLGRLWLENRPNSKLKEHMKYYIETDSRGLINQTHANQTPTNDILKISSPEEIKIIDPCCGSGHILVYAFDLLTKIYEEEGYDTNEIPYLILEKNLYGIDIDDRAASLANFALIMKARGYYKRFFKKDVETNVISMQNYSNFEKFREAKNFGSLIEITSEEYESINIDEDSLFTEDQKQMKKQALLLSQKYHCVVTNPPYMGGKGMNNSMADFVKKKYPDSKSDLFATFIEKCLELSFDKGFTSMITQHSWMFLSSYENLRKKLIDNHNFDSLVHLGTRTFEEIGGEVVQSVSFTFKKNILENDSCFIRLTDHKESKEIEFLNQKNKYIANQKDFEKIPGSPIAYWISERDKEIFENSKKIRDIAEPKQGMTTSDNNRFLRLWNELTLNKIGFGLPNSETAKISNHKWFPYNKGGDFRKWYGNNDYVINYENDGKELKQFHDLLNQTSSGGRLKNKECYFRKSITWSFIGLIPAFRYCPTGFIFDVAGSSIFCSDEILLYLLGYLCSKITINNLKILNPTLNFQVINISALPVIFTQSEDILDKVKSQVNKCIEISKEDWDSRETSWDFRIHPLTPSLAKEGEKEINIESAYKNYCEYWKSKFYQLHSNEEELNRLFIDIYELQDELTPDVELKDITILKEETFINENNELEFEKDKIIKQFISYAVGCMFGRYSIDKEGLILANQGETIQDFISKLGLMNQTPTFMPDENNVIPILDDEYFKDDIVNQFKTFIKVTFGEEKYPENLKFVEDAIGKDIRSYFLKDFYEEHIRRYKKRPIYWLFSSEKGAFNALIYMHRYRNDTASIVVNDYLREYISKLQSKRESLKLISLSESVSSADKKKADKDISIIDKKLKELGDYEQKLLHIANQKIDIDLDDGVKVNYSKFKDVLYKIKGLEKEE